MALSAHTIPTMVGSAILESLKANLVYGRLFNENYTGDVAPGNTVKVPSIGSVTVRDYTVYTDVTDQDASDASVSLAIDKQKYFSIVLDDVDAVMSKPPVLAAYAKEAAHQMKATIDAYLAAQLVAGGSITDSLGDSTTPLEINSSNVGETLRLIARKMDDAKVPRAGRYIVVPPWLVEDLVTAEIGESTGNTDTLANSFVARYAGFDVLMSHQVPATSSAKYKIVAGTSESSTMALAIDKVETIRHPDQFADKLRGLAVFGGKVVRAGAVAVATLNEAAEA